MPTPWKKNDELFKQQLARGYAYERLVAVALLDYDLWVNHGPMPAFREDVEDAIKGQYHKQRDLGVMNMAGDEYRLEVKSSQQYFTSPSNFPYEYAFACTQSSWKKKPKPDYFVIVAQSTHSMIVIPRDAVVQEIGAHDKVRDIDEIFMAAPRYRLYTFDEMVSEIIMGDDWDIEPYPPGYGS